MLPAVLSDALLQAATWGALALELLFAPLALVGRLRPWLWGLMLATHLGLMALIDFADLSFGMVILHLFTFDPGWLRPAVSGTGAGDEGDAVLFYDGHCGLCHRSVRFVLAEGGAAGRLRFAPLDSDLFRASAPEELRRTLPDSLVLKTSDGRLLTRSEGVVALLARLGGAWRVFGTLLGLVPRSVTDALYDGVARIRHRLFRPPPDACPLGAGARSAPGPMKNEE